MACKIRANWESHFVRNEALASVVAVAVLVLWWEGSGRGWLSHTLLANRGAIYSTVASLAGALLGFVLTTMTIVSGVISLPAFRRLRSSSQYPALWTVFGLTLRVLAALTAVALLGLIADRDDAPLHWVFYLLAWLSLWGAALLTRSIWILEKTIATATRFD